MNKYCTVMYRIRSVDQIHFLYGIAREIGYRISPSSTLTPYLDENDLVAIFNIYYKYLTGRPESNSEIVYSSQGYSIDLIPDCPQHKEQILKDLVTASLLGNNQKGE